MDIESSLCVNIPEILLVHVAISSFVSDYLCHDGPTIAWQLRSVVRDLGF